MTSPPLSLATCLRPPLIVACWSGRRLAGLHYFAFTDPSGDAHDSFTLGISHREKDGSAVLDLLFERKAPFNPSEVTAGDRGAVEDLPLRAGNGRQIRGAVGR